MSPSLPPSLMRRRAPALWRLLRPTHWSKNVVVLMPLIFSGRWSEGTTVTWALGAAAVFSLAASAAYVVNDFRDRQQDRRHPHKVGARPLASGEVSPRRALMLLAALYALLIAAGLAWPPVGIFVAGYLALNLAYSFGLKQVAIVELFVIAVGFVLRAGAGAAAIGHPLSPWMATTVLCLALHLAAVKRRQELRACGIAAREVLSRYTDALLDRYQSMSASCAICFYGMFVLTAQPALAPTLPLVLFGLMRHAYAVEMRGFGESPVETLYRDRPTALLTLAWIGACLCLVPHAAAR